MMSSFRNSLLDGVRTERRRIAGPGLGSVWIFSAGPRFLIKMECLGCGRFLYWAVDGKVRDITHLVQGPGVRDWIRQSWDRHLAELTWHERVEYASKGVIRG